MAMGRVFILHLALLRGKVKRLLILEHGVPVSKVCSHFIDTTLLDEMGFHGLLIRVVMHRFHSL